MDDDVALRTLGAQLEQENPELAALLSGTDARPPRLLSWRLLAFTALVVAAVPLDLGLAARFGPVVLGVTTFVLALAAPLVAGWAARRSTG